MKVTIDFTDGEVERIKEKGGNLEDFIKRAVYRQLYEFDTTWQKHIELKIAQMQEELDTHRLNSKDDSFSVLDTNLNKRVNDQKCVLDANDFSDLQQSEYKPKQFNKPKNKRDRSDAPVVSDIDINL